LKLLVCGGLGFIGSEFIRNHFKHYPDDKITNIDKLGIGSNLENLKEISTSNYKFFKGKIEDQTLIDSYVKNADIIVNFAAESHVDRSISDPQPFIDSNILGVYSILEAVKKYDTSFIQVSTDEVYGDAIDLESFTETDRLNPSSPYSASKASGDMLVIAYVRTYGIKGMIARCTNNFGPYQHPEKLIPKTIIRASKNMSIPLHGSGEQIRSWIHVNDHVDAIETLIQKGNPGQIYNISADYEFSVKEIIEMILEKMGKPKSLIKQVEDRPGQDKKYSLDSTKIKESLNWKPSHSFEDALSDTINWYLNNPSWWEPLSNDVTLHSKQWTIKQK